MSFREDKFQQFKGTDFDTKMSYVKNMSEEEIKDLFLDILQNGVHGFCFSLYEDGQKPGDIISEDQIRRRLQILKPYTSWVRSFSCTDGNELIPKVAKELGMKTLVGAWLGNDKEKNAEEINNLLQLVEDGVVDIIAVGNEVLYRHDLEEYELLDYIREVKSKVTNIPVGYVDAYYEFVNRPAITELCDVLLCNCYPYWEGTSFQDSFNHMQHMYYMVKGVSNGKPVIITETGWPSKGEGLGGAVPSPENALNYFINTMLWSKDFDIDVLYFSSFDESWKQSDEGEVGAYWGIWDKNGKLKY